jgi:hypothetical protein
MKSVFLAWLLFAFVSGAVQASVSVPGQHGGQFLSVGAEMEGAHITEIESHVWFKQ